MRETRNVDIVVVSDPERGGREDAAGSLADA
jgi:hypothetical protein